MTDDERDQRDLDLLNGALPRVAPPADLWDRIAQEIRHPAAEVIPLRPHRFTPARLLTAGAAVAAVAAAVVAVLVVQPGGSGAATAVAAIVAHEPGADVHGTAKLFNPARPEGRVHLSLASVPAPPSGHHYEVWVLGRGQTTMTAVGSFTPAARSVKLDLPLPAPGDYAAVDISVQKDNGPPQHSSVSLAGGTFHPA
jgi:hypothetical protein